MNAETARRPAHRFLAHRGEARLRLWAATPAELFQEAARGLARMLDRGGRRGPLGPWRDVTVEAPDQAALLVDWLNELIFLAETESVVPAEVAIVSLSENHLAARVRGAALPEPPSLVKAATLHGARLAEDEGGYQGEIVFDI